MGQYPQDSVTAGHPATGPIEDYEAIESDRRTATTFLRLILVSIPVAAIVVFFGSADRRAGLRHVFGVQSSELAQSRPAAASPTSSAPADARANAADPAAVDRLVVQLKAVQRSWVSAIVDGQRVLQRIFQPGDEHTLDVRRDIVLTVQDGAAITVTLNGAAAKPMGPSGQTATARLNLTNFRDYLVAP